MVTKISYGIICFRINSSGIKQYLLVCRKFSISFDMFVRGRYNVDKVDSIDKGDFIDRGDSVNSDSVVKYDFITEGDSIDKVDSVTKSDSVVKVDSVTRGDSINNDNRKLLTDIKSLISGMTIHEQKLLLTKSFDELWCILNFMKDKPRLSEQFLRSKNKFKKLEFYLQTRYNKTMSELINENKSEFTTPEWEFPKGRRKKNESPLSCALREFTEETGIDSSNCEFPFGTDKTTDEMYVSYDNNSYRCHYFVCRIKKNSIPKINHRDKNQVAEISQVRWVSYNDGIKLLRDSRKSYILSFFDRIIS